LHRYLAWRLAHALVVIVGVLVVVFFMVRLSGDPAALYLPPEASADDLNALRRQLGYDRPLLVQLADFLGRAARGDFGVSLRQRVPALELVVTRVPATLRLAGFALTLTVLLAVPLGVAAAVKRGSAIDMAVTTLALLGQCMPTFWTGIVAILLFSLELRWFPTSGSGSFRHLVLPGAVLGSYSAAVVTRLIRSSMLDILASDFVRTGRAKGLREWTVLVKHALKNAAIPAVTALGLQVSVLMGGAIVTEQVFAYPGMARLAVQAIANRDIEVVQAFVALNAAIIVAVSLVVDLAYLMLDPRIRYG
jgi:peptide/nickel transport system permease protein